MYITVALTRSILGDYQAEAWHILPDDHVRVVANSEQGFADAVAQLRKGLAYMGIWGDLEFENFSFADDLAHIKAAIDALTDEEVTVTPEDTQQVRREVAEKEKSVTRGMERLLEFMKAQSTDEEEGDLTVGEAFRRYKEGEEQMRRIVEGEEAGPNPEDEKKGHKEGERPPDNFT